MKIIARWQIFSIGFALPAAFTLFVVLSFATSVFAQHPAWTNSNVKGSPDPPKPFHVRRVFPNLEFRNPVEAMPLADTGKMLLLQVNGQMYLFDEDDNAQEAKLVLDIGKHLGESGSLRAFGFGVHPKFSENHHIFVVYRNAPVNDPKGSSLSRFTMIESNDGWSVDAASEEVLLTWASGGHNGSTVRFDPQGLLYFSAGDGARPYPPDEYDVGQNLADLRSSICRIDPDKPDGERLYSIPKDNPFVDLPGARGEIWAFGFRNPWRFDFVPGTNRILCGDVGWELWELVHDVRRGTNHGWSIYEGPQSIRSDVKLGPSPITRPAVSYPHTVGQSITGGHVYQGSKHAELNGLYLYGDYVTGILWGLKYDSQHLTENPVLAETGLRIISFSQNSAGETLVLDYAGGIYELVPSEPVSASAFPKKLSETGIFADTSTLALSNGVQSYEVSAQAWQDGAKAQFAVGIPSDDPVVTHRMKRNWRYPKDTVFAKTLSQHVQTASGAEWKRIETQLLHFDGMNWQPYSYLWNDQQTDASLVDANGAAVMTKVVDGNGDVTQRVWRVSNRAECRSCHTPQTGGAVGFSFENLGSEQLERLVKDGWLDRVAPQSWRVRHMVDPSDDGELLRDRARSYLAANCAHCHRRGGGGTVPLDLEYSNPNVSINAIDFKPTQGDFGIESPAVIAPGDPTRSVLFYRMATSGSGHMPKLWSRENDIAGLQLMRDWIGSMKSKEDAPTIPAAEMNPQNTRQAISLFVKLMDKHGDKAQHTEVTRTARQICQHDAGLIGGLFERFLPAEERRRQLGPDINATQILAMQGDPNAGRDRFMTSSAQLCIRCHRVLGSGQSIGPDLDGIGSKRSRKEILQSILDPAATIEPAYKMTVILKANGNIVHGIVLHKDDQNLEVLPQDGRKLRIPQGQIEQMKESKQSMMPSGLADYLTAQELADMLAFLESLK